MPRGLAGSLGGRASAPIRPETRARRRPPSPSKRAQDTIIALYLNLNHAPEAMGRVISRLGFVECPPRREGTGDRFSRILGRGRRVIRCWWPSTSSPVRPEGSSLDPDAAATAGTQPEDPKVRGTVGRVAIGDGSGSELSRARRPRGSLRPGPWQSAEPRLGLGGSRDGR